MRHQLVQELPVTPICSSELRMAMEPMLPPARCTIDLRISSGSFFRRFLSPSGSRSHWARRSSSSMMSKISTALFSGKRSVRPLWKRIAISSEPTSTPVTSPRPQPAGWKMMVPLWKAIILSRSRQAPRGSGVPGTSRASSL